MTDNMSFDPHGFDPTDTELARRLEAAAPPAGNADSVLAGLRPRLTRARRRRQAGLLAVGAAALVLFAGVAFAATDPDHDSRVRVPPATRPPATVDTAPAPTTPPTPTTPTSTDPTAPVASPDGRATSPTSPATPPPTGATTPPTAPATPPTTVDDHGGNRGPGSTNSGPGSGSSGSGSSSLGSSGSGSSGPD